MSQAGPRGRRSDGTRRRHGQQQSSTDAYLSVCVWCRVWPTYLHAGQVLELGELGLVALHHVAEQRLHHHQVRRSQLNHHHQQHSASQSAPALAARQVCGSIRWWWVVWVCACVPAARRWLPGARCWPCPSRWRPSSPGRSAPTTRHTTHNHPPTSHRPATSPEVSTAPALLPHGVVPTWNCSRAATISSRCTME